jgi:hypothetical protein
VVVLVGMVSPGRMRVGKTRGGGATRYARPCRPWKHLLTIWVWKARSVAQDRQRSVSGRVRERRRVEEGVVGEVGEVEREGTAEVLLVLLVLLSVGDGGSGLPVIWSAGSEVRRRVKGMRREGRR